MTELEYYLDRIKSHQKFKREEMKFEFESGAIYKDTLAVDILDALACILKTLVKYEGELFDYHEVDQKDEDHEGI